MEVSDEENQLEHEARLIVEQLFRSGAHGVSPARIAYEALKRGKELGRKAGEEVNRAIQAREDRNFRRQLVCAMVINANVVGNENALWKWADEMIAAEPKPK